MAKKFASDSPTMDEILAHKKPNETSVEVIIDPVVSKKIKALEKDLVRQKAKESKGGSLASQVPKLQGEIDELWEKSKEDTITFTFQDIGKKAFDTLLEDSPPAEGQQTELGYEWDPNTLGPKLIAACSLEPEISMKQADKIWDEWSRAEAEILFMTALSVCMEVTRVPKSSSDSDEIDVSDLSLDTLLTKDSATPST